jgi:hypothetical protein
VRVSSSQRTELSALTTEILLMTSRLLFALFPNPLLNLSLSLSDKLGRPTVDPTTSDKVVHNAQHEDESEDSAGPVYHIASCQHHIDKGIV